MRTFTGTYGVAAILPFNPEKIQRLVDMYAPNAEYKLSERPSHITLYHGPLKDMPEDLMMDIVQTLALPSDPHRHRVSFHRIRVYGGKFLFWEVLNSEYWGVRHYAALALAKYLDPAAVAPATKEDLNLSEIEARNLRDFGHPLVGPQRRLHLTLAYSSSGFSLTGYDCEFGECCVKRYAFVKIGEYGSVEEVVYAVDIP